MAAPFRLTPVKAPALSLALDSVYWAVAVSPLRRRRRSWTWPACRRRSAVRRQVHEPGGTRRARIHRAGRIGVGQEFLHQPTAPGAQIRRQNGERCGQVLLHGRLPVLGVADAEVRIDGERVRSVPGRRHESIGQRERIGRAVLHAERLRERRLLRQQQRDRLIDVRVAIDAIAAADDQRGTGNGTPRDPHARLHATPVRTHERLRIAHAGQRPDRIVRHDRADGGEPGRHVEVHEPSEQLGERRFVLPSQPGVEGQAGAQPPVVGDVDLVGGRAQVFVGVAERDRAGARDAQQEIGADRSPCTRR